MTTNSKLTKKDLAKIYWRSCQLDMSWDYERQQHIAYSYGISSAIDKIYKNDPEKKKRALQRGLDFMACTPQIVPFIMGIDVALNEENVNTDTFDESIITSIKTSLMGPMAGIGDSLIPATLRIIATGIGISFSMAGNPLGPILFLLTFNIPCYFIRYYSLKFGYKFGTKLITSMANTNIMDTVSYSAAIVGLMVVGGMIYSQIWLDLPIMVGSGDFAQPLVTYLDQIMPGLIQLGLFGLMYYLLGKKVKTTTILWAVLGICIGLTFIGSLF
ncbi:PTS system mannose/fructose/sorbose family transporter subunit IID [uncultured Traorella sp.]|uniref:PTS system mannose/fructose/sorbose family transporter subunit IID n=1 Tax=uncultured Traorella sp. TaxID=1929048 RepID=UPI0025EBFC26|nr:PTS system mannose/fructose/sorbose family transporter subunit IID [uncultured Traorella sp.]